MTTMPHGLSLLMWTAVLVVAQGSDCESADCAHGCCVNGTCASTAAECEAIDVSPSSTETDKIVAFVIASVAVTLVLTALLAKFCVSASGKKLRLCLYRKYGLFPPKEKKYRRNYSPDPIFNHKKNSVVPVMHCESEVSPPQSPTHHARLISPPANSPPFAQTEPTNLPPLDMSVEDVQSSSGSETPGNPATWIETPHDNPPGVVIEVPGQDRAKVGW
eukprot:TRINITY_DN17635_c0_g1_i1.p1 TRINITY_DN17635_c0_g1~~TRINITY_DN17635_c0_g1_i1.p1  ORF type:complete len:218 (+),score=34.27 TRINITY_DN17635_c0_g1_i1:37-690(+)